MISRDSGLVLSTTSDDRPIGTDEDHVQRSERVFHPHADRLRASEEEQHAAVLRHPLPEHQAALLQGRGIRDFNVEDLGALVGLDDDGLDARRVLRKARPGDDDEKSKEGEKSKTRRDQPTTQHLFLRSEADSRTFGKNDQCV